MKTIWARIGITLELADDEYNKILDRMYRENTDELTDEEITLFLEKGKADGESYIPNIDDYERA